MKVFWPHRLRKTLAELKNHLGSDRKVSIARELSKRYEEIWRGSLEEAVAHFAKQEPRGQFTVAISVCATTETSLSETELLERLSALITQGLSPSQASRQLARETGQSKRTIYQLSLTLEPGA